MFRAIAEDVDYCPLNHLAQALYFDAWRDCGFVVASTIYADASGNDHCEPLCLVAGWWNSVENWTEFGQEWKAFLKRRDIVYLHQTGDDEWKRDKQNRVSVLDEACQIIERSGAISHAFFTPTDDWDACVSEAKEQGFDKPDCFAWNAFRFVTHVLGWCEDRHLRMPEFIFEASSRKEEHALRVVMEDYKLPEPIFRRKLEEDPERTVVALQPADFVAYEIFRGWKDIIAKNVTSRRHLLAFERIEHSWAYADKAQMDLLLP